MSRIEEVEEAVQAQADTTIADISGTYNEGCQNLLNMWFDKLKAFTGNLQQVMDLLDSLKKDLDTNYENLPDFPDLPETPEIVIDTPDEKTIDLDCPIAECLGFPSAPAVSFPDGLPAVQTAETLAQFREYSSAMKKTASKLAESVGLSAEVTAKNALTALQSGPQALLNGLVDMATASIAELAGAELMAEFDANIACLEAKDARFSRAEEIVRYKELKSRVEAVRSSDGSLNMSGLGISDELAGSLTDFNSKKSELTGKLDSAKGMLGKFV